MKQTAPLRAAERAESTPATQDANELMQTLLSKGSDVRPIATPIFGIVIGSVVSTLPDGRLQLSIPALSMESVEARVACVPDGLVSGAEVAVMFEQGDIARALVMGPMYAGANEKATRQAEQEVLVDHQRVVIEAGQELELRCGEAAIILTADGRILQRGTYISSHASATQRILGGSVQIN
jgi:hypothetical protein